MRLDSGLWLPGWLREATQRPLIVPRRQRLYTPGFFWGGCPCCGSCAWSDDFSTANTYTTHEVSGTPVFSVSSGRLSVSGGTGTYYQTTGPASSSLSIAATVYQGTGQTGIFIGSGVAFVADWAAGELQRFDVDADGDSTGSPVSFSTVADGDKLRINLVQVGVGTFDIDFVKNTSVVRQETGVSLGVDLSQFVGGLWGSGGEWDDFSISCAAQTDECPHCPDGAPLEWELEYSGVGNVPPIGTDPCDPPEDCQKHNEPWTLGYNGGLTCGWTSETRFMCSITAGGARWELNRDPDPPVTWFLNMFHFTGSVHYSLLESEFDCLGENVFEFSSNNFNACNWENVPTVTIRPK